MKPPAIVKAFWPLPRFTQGTSWTVYGPHRIENAAQRHREMHPLPLWPRLCRSRDQIKAKWSNRLSKVDVMKLRINGETRDVVHASEALLWVLHDELGLTGSHLGCGVGLCGSCSVLVDGVLTRSCQTTAADVANNEIVTIEGLVIRAVDGSPALHPVQQAFIENPLQCMWCLPGHIMAAVELLAVSANPSPAETDESIDRNLCRCGGYPIIRAAVERAIELSKRGSL